MNEDIDLIISNVPVIYTDEDGQGVDCTITAYSDHGILLVLKSSPYYMIYVPNIQEFVDQLLEFKDRLEREFPKSD